MTAGPDPRDVEARSRSERTLDAMPRRHRRRNSTTLRTVTIVIAVLGVLLLAGVWTVRLVGGDSLTRFEPVPGRAEAPATPSGIAAEAGPDQESVSVSWRSVDGADGYVVRYRPTGEVEWALHPASTKDRTTINGLRPGVAYELQVRARNSVGVSAWAPDAPVRVTPTAGQPRMVSVASAVEDAVSEVIDFDRPADLTADDLLVAALGKGDAAGAWSAPPGWSLIGTRDSRKSDLAVFTRVVTDPGAEPARYEFRTSAAYKLLGTLSVVRGANGRAPIENASIFSLSSESNAPIAKSIATFGPNRLLMAFVVMDARSTFTPPAQMNEAADIATTAGQVGAMSMALALQSAAGPSGEKRFASTIAEEYSTVLIAVRP